jgi:hypothetical protein
MARGVEILRRLSARSAFRGTRLETSDLFECDKILAALSNSRGGRDLRGLGFDADLERAAACDLFDLVPEFIPRTGVIQPVRREAEALRGGAR